VKRQFVDWSVYDAVIRQFAENGKSAKEAADQIAQLTRHPVTRNSILGRANRLGVRFNSLALDRPAARVTEVKDWEEKGDEILRQRAAEKVPSYLIAEELEKIFGWSVTRYTVMNRARRIGIKLHKRARSADRTFENPPKARPTLPRGPANSVEPVPDNVTELTAGHLHISIMELTKTTCRWPTITDNQGELRYCGQPTRYDGRVYCPRCHKRAHNFQYVPLQKRKAS
jgi:hypothetical protein